jgi:hypothetical protein
VPPAAATADAGTYDQCFCSQAGVSPFSTGVSGVCDAACTATAADITSIQAWYTGFCAGANSGASQTTGTSGSTTATSKPLTDSGGGGNWISTHWQWVIMLVILVVGITGIWVGACIWRRRYLAKRDRTAALGKVPAADDSWAPGGAGVDPSGSDVSRQPGQFMPGTAATTTPGEGEKEHQRRTWQVAQRT